MSIALICLFVACLLPIVCAGAAKAIGSKQGAAGGFDNNHPREWLSKQTGASARLNAAGQNSWEALAIFGPAVLAALLQGANAARVDQLALVFIGARVVYIALYAANAATLRSLVWTVGLVAALALFFAKLF